MSEQASKTTPEKGRASPKKKSEEVPIYKLYEVKGNTVNRLRKECPRCGKGVFLGEHRDRLTCGRCGYTSFKKSAQK